MADLLPSPIPPPDPVPAKPDVRSKTFWFNFVMGLLSLIATYVVKSLTETDLFSLRGAYLDPDVKVGVMSLSTLVTLLKLAVASPGVIAAINMILRYYTKSAVIPFWSSNTDAKLTPEDIAKIKAFFSGLGNSNKFPPALPMIFAIVLLCGSVTMAAAPKALIVGPTSGTPGELLELDASTSLEATHFRWWVSPVLPGRKQIDPIGDGKKVRIASLPGTYTYTVGVSNPEGLDVFSWVVTIPGELPAPGPTPAPPCPSPLPAPPAPYGPAPPVPTPVPVPAPPTPPPAPEPSFPAGKFNVAGDVYREAMKVASPNRAAEASALASAFEVVASSAAAGIYDNRLSSMLTAKAVSNAMIEANRKVFPSGSEAWADFGKKAGDRATALYNAGKVATGADWAVLLRETAMGLRAAGVK